MGTTRDDVAEAVRQIIRVDLKFADIEIPDSLELVGGGLSLDSLDLLMMVSALEKRFGHKSPQKKLRRETMATVGALIEFTHAELVEAGK